MFRNGSPAADGKTISCFLFFGATCECTVAFRLPVIFPSLPISPSLKSGEDCAKCVGTVLAWGRAAGAEDIKGDLLRRPAPLPNGLSNFHVLQVVVYGVLPLGPSR